MHIFDAIKDTVLWSALIPSGVILQNEPGLVSLPPNRNPIETTIDYPLEQNAEDGHLPLVVWHGMGDSYNSSSMQKVTSIFQSTIPSLFVYSIYVNPDNSKDQQSSVLGNLNEQIDFVCDQLSSVPELQNGFNAIGFSQGGLFLRCAMEKCGLPINNLITFGSPHNGVNDLPQCKSNDWLCKKRNQLLKSQVWHEDIQKNVVQAQYFRDTVSKDGYLNYLEHSGFLVFMNNEYVADPSYKENFVKLTNKFVMVMFTEDTMVTPKESAWFQDIDLDTGDVLKFDETDAFNYDLIGLKTLFKSDKIDFLKIDNDHMVISNEFLLDIALRYL